MMTDKILEVVNMLRERKRVIDDQIEVLERLQAGEKEQCKIAARIKSKRKPAR